MLWRSTLRTIKKIAASIVLGAGIFVLVCACLKSIFVLVVSAYWIYTPIYIQNLLHKCTNKVRTLCMAHNLLAHGEYERPSSLSW